MNLLKQCETWNEKEEYEKVIEALETLPEEECTPELYRELACAYYYLDQEGPALRYFEQALRAYPDDKYMLDLMEDCKKRLSMPIFAKPFRERVKEAWAAFEKEEGELRALLDQKDRMAAGEELVARCDRILRLAFTSPSFELGRNGEKYELILTPEWEQARLFSLVSFAEQAPESVREHWSIRVGRQPSQGFSLRKDGVELGDEEVQVWVRKQGEREIFLEMYCEKLLPMLEEEEGRAYWFLYTLAARVLGEIPAMGLIEDIEILTEPKEEPGISLKALPEALAAMGVTLEMDAGVYLDNSYLGYEREPNRDPDAAWRMDVFAGASRLAQLIREYQNGETDTVDAFHRDGIAAGFFSYSTGGFEGEDRGKQILDFRDALETFVEKKAGKEAVTFLGGASGIYCGYLDFIAWDLQPVLEAAVEFFANTSLPWADFHTFRRNVDPVRLAAGVEAEPKLYEETGSILSPEEIGLLESFDEGDGGYFYQMLDCLMDMLKKGNAEGRFTGWQAGEDLQVALWYSYACNNIDEYEYYYRTAQWMPDSEKHAAGCGTWYYRYSVALMYCGRLEEAYAYAERGTVEEPDYPWIWLQAGKLRSHFGDKEGALAAAKQGLLLMPGDYEFELLEWEIQRGCSLEQMEYHWIDPDSDRALQEGQDPGAADKLRAIACMVTDEQGLATFMELFRPRVWEKDAPYCSFQEQLQGQEIELVFRMNEAALSKLDMEWFRLQKERLDSGDWLLYVDEEDTEWNLKMVSFERDYRVTLHYGRQGTEEVLAVLVQKDGTLIRASGYDTEVYTEEEMEVVDSYIGTCYGDIESVMHELVSPDIHVDICVIPPTEEKNYYTLVTMGMGAHRMEVPEELSEEKLERAELVIALPPDWRIGGEDEEWYWPIRLLKVLARMPGACDTWLSWGHTIDNGEPFAENTELSSCILISPLGVEEGAECCVLPGGDTVNFYQVIPLYAEETEYKREHGAEKLLEKMAGISCIVDPKRPNVME